MHWAALYGRVEVAKALLESGAAAEAKDRVRTKSPAACLPRIHITQARSRRCCSLATQMSLQIHSYTSADHSSIPLWV